MNNLILEEIQTADQLAGLINSGNTIFAYDGVSYRLARQPYVGYIMEDDEGIEYIVPFIEFEKETYYYMKEQKKWLHL